jgi:hypothetical protein
MDLQEKGQISQKFDNSPHCYLAGKCTTGQESFLILDDLHQKGYRKAGTMDFVHAKAAMQILGRFHALSFALESDRPQEFLKYKELTDVLHDKVEDEDFKNFVNLNFDTVVCALEPDEEAKIRKILKIRENFHEDLKLFTDPLKAEPFCVLTHGEFGTKNLKFLYGVGQYMLLSETKIINFKKIPGRWRHTRCKNYQLATFALYNAGTRSPLFPVHVHRS